MMVSDLRSSPETLVPRLACLRSLILRDFWLDGDIVSLAKTDELVKDSLISIIFEFVIFFQRCENSGYKVSAIDFAPLFLRERNVSASMTRVDWLFKS